MEDNIKTKGQWSDREVFDFLSVLNKDHIKRDTYATTRNKVKVFQEISWLMFEEYGHSRTPTQCRDKFRRLKKSYREAKEHRRNMSPCWEPDCNCLEFIPELDSPVRAPKPPPPPMLLTGPYNPCPHTGGFASTEESVSGMLPKNPPATSPSSESKPVTSSQVLVESLVQAVTTPRPRVVKEVVCVVGGGIVPGMLPKDPPSTSPSSESAPVISVQVLESPVQAVSTPRPHTVTDVVCVVGGESVSGMLPKHPPSTSPSSESPVIASSQVLESPVGAVTTPLLPHALFASTDPPSTSPSSELAPVISRPVLEWVLGAPRGPYCTCATTNPPIVKDGVCVACGESVSGMPSKDPPSPSSESPPMISVQVLESTVGAVTTPRPQAGEC
ncbi:nascent polypeptide-associated complex subunit alpha, muscle-specific form-like [Engraulis encrasicolus]|uniref:nascent polypeptide-associated complex subunit alpha, muscle-specific form-like n=1 Tax=Engraulis encrasicolus TaxID=184585 RepID=UPI002FCE6B4D